MGNDRDLMSALLESLCFAYVTWKNKGRDMELHRAPLMVRGDEWALASKLKRGGNPMDKRATNRKSNGRRPSSFAVPLDWPPLPIACAALGAALALKGLLTLHGMCKRRPAAARGGQAGLPRQAAANQPASGASSGAAASPPASSQPQASDAAVPQQAAQEGVAPADDQQESSCTDSDDSSVWEDGQAQLPELTPADIAAAALRLFGSRDDAGTRGGGTSPRWLHHATRLGDPALAAALEAEGWIDGYSCCRPVPQPRDMSTACLGDARRPVTLLVAYGAAGDGYMQVGQGARLQACSSTEQHPSGAVCWRALPPSHTHFHTLPAGQRPHLLPAPPADPPLLRSLPGGPSSRVSCFHAVLGLVG